MDFISAHHEDGVTAEDSDTVADTLNSDTDDVPNADETNSDITNTDGTTRNSDKVHTDGTKKEILNFDKTQTDINNTDTDTDPSTPNTDIVTNCIIDGKNNDVSTNVSNTETNNADGTSILCDRTNTLSIGTHDAEVHDKNKTQLVVDVNRDNSPDDTQKTSEAFCLYSVDESSVDEAVYESISASVPPPDHLMSLTLPPKMTFTLPEGAEFARRHDDLKALFRLPPQTKFHFANGKEVRIPPEEAMFYCDRVLIQNGYTSYRVASCPGSSGGCMLLDGGNSFLNTLAHGGGVGGGVSMCGLRCYPILPSAV